ncbi:MAG: hypothetical protein WC858_02375 [Parcubacteria group bacterium]|jgi:hypothetical protein
MPNILTDLAAALPTRFVGMMMIGNILFLLYVLKDLFFLVMKLHFGRINIDLVVFTRNDNTEQPTDELIFRTIVGPIFLQQEYRNDFLFWKVIFRSMRATFDRPVLTFKRNPYAALIPFRERVSSKYALGHFNRASGHKYEKKKCWLVMVDEKRRSKNRNILKVLMLLEEDLEKITCFLENPPTDPDSKNNFELFKKVAKAFQETPKAFLDVEVVVAKRT